MDVRVFTFLGEGLDTGETRSDKAGLGGQYTYLILGESAFSLVS